MVFYVQRRGATEDLKPDGLRRGKNQENPTSACLIIVCCTEIMPCCRNSDTQTRGQSEYFFTCAIFVRSLNLLLNYFTKDADVFVAEVKTIVCLLSFSQAMRESRELHEHQMYIRIDAVP